MAVVPKRLQTPIRSLRGEQIGEVEHLTFSWDMVEGAWVTVSGVVWGSEESVGFTTEIPMPSGWRLVRDRRSEED